MIEISNQEENSMTTPVLYIIMRDDLVSLNCGKAMAQAAHAGNAMEYHYQLKVDDTINNVEDSFDRSKFETLIGAYGQWKRQTSQGFGTTIVLGGAMSSIRQDVDVLEKLGYLAAVVHDPTYPLRDGSFTHLIPLDTCAYVFVPNKDDPIVRAVLSKYELHP
jgi:peptidyl-tRNA hydrolase